ncbi:glycoside hydrolase family 9 protein [Scleromatobacter humisilvae]|uniref:Glycoside hydrolase family 9 protein n=1 Tax=Scleromatobacter humisilvae TaxID=2897159 RepID=A0A9X1YNC3_9BURK|nr:glycoside hydrolase family 9 protein [Scleromatobacter humisilvae]MCK9687547.1 glycoside hydrolase family 9 protein [Scleromatobacter humisilvae]
MQVLLNHVGFAPAASKRATLQHTLPLQPQAFAVVNLRTRAVVHTGVTEPTAPVAGWRDRHFAHADFSAVTTPGRYAVMLEGTWPPVQSQPFEVADGLFGSQMLSDIVHYFKGQRCTGLFDDADRRAPLLDTREPRDVHGGWYDASGDCSKYLSHLSYANFMNPQQTPLVTWTLLAGRDAIPPQSKWLDERIVDEALHGADFLVRMQSPEGFFYTTIFDKWSKDEHQREICSYATQKGIKSADYQAGFRQGGGMAIAALARAAGAPRDGEFKRSDYLAAAIRGFELLEQRNAEFLDDHAENLIDDYCALLAATELYAATREPRWAGFAARYAKRQMAQQDEQGFYWADRARTRSFFHASDAGLPHLALVRFVEVVAAIDPGLPTGLARAAVARGLAFELRATNDGGANPLGYPRQHVVMPGREGATQFFVPHDNESGYWWQGENARLGSLATAARAAQALHLADDAFDAQLAAYAQRALDWLFGANPFDTCMLQGWGHNPPRYEPGFWNAPGGVCNGITSGLADEADIDFRKPEETEPAHSWRWTEQWIPHAAWLFCALAHGRPRPEKSFHPIDADRR